MASALLEAIGLAEQSEGESFAARLANRRIYHATPLHYLPSIVQSGTLLSARAGQALGIQPRVSALRRDRMLGVDEYVHFAFDLVTPLLCDKLSRGIPHAALVFDAGRVYADDPAACALLPCNTKAYRSRAACAPERGDREMTALLKSRDEFHRRAGLEFLVQGTLPLHGLIEITAFCERDTALIRALLHAFRPELSALIVERRAPGYAQAPIEQTQDYYHGCISARRALMPPPKIEFD